MRTRRLAICFVAVAFCMRVLAAQPATASMLEANDSQMLAQFDLLVKSDRPLERKIDELQATVEKFRSGEVTFASGEWKLTQFYNFVGSWVKSLKLDDYYPQWQARFPNSPSPQLLRAQDLVYNAMGPLNKALAMGGNTQSWRPDATAVATARQHLLSIRNVSEADPYWYVLMARLALLDTRDDAAFARLMVEAIRKFPAYHDLYAAAADYYLPKWGGSAADLEMWAKHIARETQDLPQAFAYARTYMQAIHVEYGSSAFVDSRGNWPQFKADAIGYLRAYPDLKNVARMTMVACIAGDHAETARLVGLNPKELYLGFWLNAEDRASCIRWALAPAPKPKASSETSYIARFVDQVSGLFESIAGLIDAVRGALVQVVEKVIERIGR